MKPETRSTLLKLTAFLCALVLGAPGVYAQSSTGSQPVSKACDPAYLGALKAKAALEVQREMIENQNFIAKPGSVLEYNCFDRFLGHNAQYAGPLFVEYRGFGSTGMEPNAMETALKNVVGNSNIIYNEENFDGPILSEEGQTEDHKPGDGSKGTYTCDMMSKVWQRAKCANFMDDPGEAATDGFYTFVDLQQIEDPRKLPEACSGAEPPWEQWISDSRDPQFMAPAAEDFSRIRAMTTPGECSRPINTGVSVKVSGASYPDGACLNGCTFKRDGSCE